MQMQTQTHAHTDTDAHTHADTHRHLCADFSVSLPAFFVSLYKPWVHTGTSGSTPVSISGALLEAPSRYHFVRNLASTFHTDLTVCLVLEFRIAIPTPEKIQSPHKRTIFFIGPFISKCHCFLVSPGPSSLPTGHPACGSFLIHKAPCYCLLSLVGPLILLIINTYLHFTLWSITMVLKITL